MRHVYLNNCNPAELKTRTKKYLLLEHLLMLVPTSVIRDGFVQLRRRGAVGGWLILRWKWGANWSLVLTLLRYGDLRPNIERYR